MANTAAVLLGYLQSAVRDTTNATWTTTEMNNAIARAVRELAPRIVRPLDPEATTTTLVEGTYFYSLPTGVTWVTALDLLDAAGEELGRMQPGTWETVGDLLGGSGKLHVHPNIVDGIFGGTIRYHGYGRYDVTTNYILDEHINLVIAKAEVTLLHHLKGDRARFLQWANTMQTQNTSLNEILETINNAEQRARELEGKSYTFRKPVPA